MFINGEESSLSDALSGIPQDSVLGPALFKYSSMTYQTLLQTLYKNADDTKVYITISTISAVTVKTDKVVKLV